MILNPPLTLPSVYANKDWELPITYYSTFPDSKVIFSLYQPTVVSDSITSQDTNLTNGISNFNLNLQREESGVQVYEIVLNGYSFGLKNLCRGIITETRSNKEVVCTPLYVSVLPNILTEEIEFKFGKQKYSENLENLISSIWLESGKEVMSYSIDGEGKTTAVYGNSNEYRIFKFLDDAGDFLPSDSFIKLTKINEDQSNSVIEHYKVLNSYRNEQGEGIDKFTKIVIDKKPVSYVKIDTTTLLEGDYVVQAWYTIGKSAYKSSPIHFQV
jgi:hypothetical protein